MNITYTPDPYTTREQWAKHGILFIFVMVLCHLAFTMTNDTALHTMAWIAVAANIGVLLLAVYESVNVNRHR